MAKKLGEVFLEFTLRKRGVDEGLDETKRKAEDLGKPNGPFAKAGEAASKLQAVVSRILIPAAVVASIAAVAERFKQARREAEALRKELEGVTLAQQGLAQAQALRVRQPLSELRTQVAELNAEQEKAEQAILDQLDKRLEQLDSIGKQIASEVSGLFTDDPTTREEFAALAEQEMERVRQVFKFRRQLTIEEYDLRKELENRLQLEAEAQMRQQIREEERERREMQERLFRQQIDDVLKLFQTFREEALSASKDVTAPLEEIRGLLTAVVQNMPTATGEVF